MDKPKQPYHPLREYGVEAQGHKLVTCGPHTGHSYRNIAFCADDDTAKFIADTLAAARDEKTMQHVAYYDEGAFHWMSGIKPRGCELYAARGDV